jgi:hypothetical protein
MPRMRRSTLLALIALGAVSAGFAFSSVAVRFGDEDSATESSKAAGPQVVQLGWRETFGPKRAGFEFGVQRFEVLPDGWRARLSVKNESPVAFKVGDSRGAPDRAFGLMLFSSGDQKELETRNENGTLPAVRPALVYEPGLPDVLEPHSAWTGTISAHGSLVAGSSVRVVFGVLVAIGRTPDDLPQRVRWITDDSYRLRR